MAHEVAADPRRRPARVAAGLVGARGDAGGPRHPGDARPVRAERQGHRRPAADPVRGVRQLRHAGARIVRRDQAQQGRRAPRPGADRQRRPRHRDPGQQHGLAGGRGHHPGDVRHLLRGRGQPERPGRRPRRAAYLHPARLLARGGEHDRPPARWLVARFRGRHGGRAAAVAQAAGEQAARPRGADRRRTGGLPGGGHRGYRDGRAPGGGPGCPARTEDHVRGGPDPADWPRHHRPSAGQRGRVAAMVSHAGQRRAGRPPGPDSRGGAGP